MSNLKFEKEILQQGFKLIAGVDEVGVGSIVGPLYSAAVILDINTKFSYLVTDSKKISERVRSILCQEIKQKAIAWALGVCTKEEVENLNPLNASKLAMKRAIEHLEIRPDYVITDCHVIDVKQPQLNLKQGDLKSMTVGAASILAKHERDQLLKMMANEYPEYQWEKNAGYPTKSHKQALLRYGITPYHRRSYKCVKEIKKWNHNKKNGRSIQGI